MKYAFFVLLILFVFACRPTAPIEETSPKFNFPTDSVFTAQHDTLRIRGNFRDGFRMDSIAAGDTAWFHIEIDGVFHALTEITVSLSDNSVAELLLFPDQEYINSTFLSSSDFANGQFLVAANQRRIPFKFGYHAIQFSRNSRLTLTAHSEAPDNYNTNNFSLLLPIKRTPPPQIAFPSGTLESEQNESLQIRFISGLHRLDAMKIGDAVVLNIEISGARNKLTRLSLTPTNRIDVEITILDNSMFTENSDVENLDFEIKENIRYFTVPIQVRGVQANEDFDIVFRAYSDALFDYGVRKVVLRTPVSITN